MSVRERKPQNGAVDEVRLKVWSWAGRDPESLDHLLLVVAAGSRKELQQVSVRLSLPTPKNAHPVKKSDPAFDMAIARPHRLFWTDPENRPLGRSYEPLTWRTEEQLETFRRSGVVRRPVDRTRPPPH